MSRGPAPDRGFDSEIREVAERLRGLGIDPTHSRVALVLSYLRSEKVSRYAVRDRRKREALRSMRESTDT